MSLTYPKAGTFIDLQPKSSIIDFEYWRPIERINVPNSAAEIERELQQWGVVRRAPSGTWAAEWGFGR